MNNPADRLVAVAAGKEVPSEVHQQVLDERPVLEIDRFSLWYGTKQALHSITMPISHNKVTALVGPSGCGKSTLLRSVNRLNDLVPSVRITGDMRLNGDSIYDPSMDVIDLRKRMGMVFQKPNPFPMSIYENVVYSLRIDGENSRGVLDEVCELSLRGAAVGRTVLGLGSNCHGQGRGSHSGIARQVLSLDRHPQHAASQPHQRLHGLYVSW